MKNLLIIFSMFLLTSLPVSAEQFLPNAIVKNTITISTPKTGELGKNYYFCKNENKCSTEQVVREYYNNNGYKVMRAEYSFWKGMFILTFLDELYPQSLQPDNDLFDMELKNVKTKILHKKLKQIQKTDLRQFINKQIAKHEQGSYIRWLDEWKIEGYKNPTVYFKSPIIQEFLSTINNKTFCKIIENIFENYDNNPVGTPDYIVWNNKDMIFVKVKRKSEKLSSEQIEWGEFLIKNRILYKVVRVDDNNKHIH